MLGAWDFQFFGGFAGTVVKRSGIWYLYFQGSCCYRIVDDSVTFRQVGLATSPDGVNFTKVAGNPVISWSPNNGGEEGAVSAAAVLDPSGDLVVYYGANTEASAGREGIGGSENVEKANTFAQVGSREAARRGLNAIFSKRSIFSAPGWEWSSRSPTPFRSRSTRT